MKDPFLMQRDRFVRMRGLFVGLGGHTKWVSSATTFTSFVFKVRRELSNSEIEKYINILNFKDLPLKLLKSDACRKCFFFLIQENPVCSRKHKYGKFGRVEFGLNHDNY